MASGWAREGAVQDQIDASIEDAVNLARSQLPEGKSLVRCEACDATIPVARRKIMPGVRLCVKCQQQHDEHNIAYPSINRRGSKDSQLR